MTGVLVVGDANVDLVLRGDVVPRFGQAEQLLDAAELVLGGSASIAAAGLARLGVPTALVAVVGDDEFGRFTTAALSDAGVDIRFIRTASEAPTAITVILSADDRAILTLLGTIPLVTADDVRNAAVTVEPQHVHFASYFLTTGLVAEMPALLGWLRERGITTSIDTNWDPAESWAGVGDLLPHLDYLLPNENELLAIAGAVGADASDPQTAARALSASGPTVVVKAGKAGGWSSGVTGDLERAGGLTVDVVDTTGAGDSFDAGYLAALVDGADEKTRLRWAAVAGSLSTLGSGGTAAQPTREQLRLRLGE